MSPTNRTYPCEDLKARVCAVAALACFVILSTGCPKAEEWDSEWLTSDIASAEKSWDGFLLEFGTPRAHPSLGEGWSHGERAEDRSPFRWALERRASFSFPWDEEERRLVWIECAPFRFSGAPSQTLSFVVNGVRQAKVELRDGRARYPLEWPLESGINELEVEFAYNASDAPPAEPAEEAKSADRRRLAVAFYRLEIPREPRAGKTLGPFAVIQPRSEAPDDIEPTGVSIPAGGILSMYRLITPGAKIQGILGAENPKSLLAAAGTSLTIEVSTGAEESLVETIRTDTPSGEVRSFVMELGELSGKNARIRFRAGEHDLFLRAAIAHEVVPVPEPAPPDPAPYFGEHNVLLVVLDGAAAERMSSYGYARETTPSIDRLADRSVVFEQAVSQAVYTIASIGSLLTGQYPERHQSVSFADRLADGVVTVPGQLTLAGVKTVGISGNAVVSEVFGLDKGYETFVPVWQLPGYRGNGESVLEQAEKWLDRNGSERFFAYVHFREPHFPYDPPEPFASHFRELVEFPNGIEDVRVIDSLNQRVSGGGLLSERTLAEVRALYDGNMLYVDHLVGRLLDKIDSLGLSDNTIVVVTADHGEALLEHGFIGHNTQLYEESVRIPLMVAIPSRPARRVLELVELVDLAPTLLQLMNVFDLTTADRMQGRSLLPALEGRGLDEKAAFSRTLWDRPRYSIRDRRFKLIWDSRNGDSELFELSSDPKERVNLATRDEYAFEVGRLKQQLFEWLREQEFLRAGVASEPVQMSEEERERFDSLGYFGFLGESERRR